MNSAVAGAAVARVDDVLPVQELLGELLGFPQDRPALVQLEARRRAGGRPLGAQNKRLDEIARQVRERFGDVLLMQVAVATMPVADLIALGLKPKEALEEKRLAAGVVLPYLEQRKPLQVDVTGRSVVYLDIQIGGGEVEQNQGVVEGLVLQLDSAQLDAAANPLGSQGVPVGAQLIEDQAGAAGEAQANAQAHGLGRAPATPGGGGFPTRRHLSAPATVVSPEGQVFDAHGIPGLIQTGEGEG